jgi:hypothetical protein
MIAVNSCSIRKAVMWDIGAARRREVYFCDQFGRRERSLSIRAVVVVVEEVELGRTWEGWMRGPS